MIKLGTIGKIIITDNLKKQIDYYHKQIGNTEWSGILFFDHTGGNIHKLKDLEFTATNVYLMDVGSATFTNFENGGEVAKAFDAINDTDLHSLRGFIHSHHNMAAYFSGTDVQELVDNAPNYGFYISLVVNMSDKYVCKIIFPTTSETIREHHIRDANGELKKVRTRSTETTMLDGDLEIVFENVDTVEDWVANRIKQIADKKAEAKRIEDAKKRIPTHNGYQTRIWEDSKWQYPSKKENFNNENGLKEVQFAKALLAMDSDTTNSFQELIAGLEVLSVDEFEDFKYFMEENIEILHHNIYGNDFALGYHLKQAIEILDKQALQNNTRAVLEILREYQNINV